jgi:hypothetical protein
LLGGPLSSAGRPPPVSVTPEAAQDKLDQIFSEARLTPDLVLRIHAVPHDEAEKLRFVAPPQTITLAANRKVIVLLSGSPEVMRNHVVRLPAFSGVATTHVALSAGLGPNALPLSSREVWSASRVGILLDMRAELPDVAVLHRTSPNDRTGSVRLTLR